MSNKFLATPDDFRRGKIEVTDQSREFKRNSDLIYSTVEEMIQSDYVAPETKALGAEILKFKDDFERMAELINNYGAYCGIVAATVVNNVDNIIDSYVSGKTEL